MKFDTALFLALLCQRCYTEKQLVLAVPYLDGMAVAFRGTADEADIVTDLNQVLVPSPLGPGLIGQGFWMDYTNVPGQVLKEGPLYIAGHSLGSPLACFLAKQYKADVREIHTFGSPRWCDQEAAIDFDTAFPGNSFRWVNLKDPVPHFPSPPLFWHVDKLHWGDVKGDFWDSNRTWAFQCHLRDHYIASYIDLFQRASHVPP